MANAISNINSIIPSHIGNLDQSGKDFTILASNAPFELLCRYDKATRTKNSNGLDGDGSKYNIGKSIANSIIICAPQEENKQAIYNYNYQVSYIDNDNTNDMTNGDIILSQTGPETTVQKSGTSFVDSGKFDIVVTDSYGVPVCITPPFNDIDTYFFTTQMSNTLTGDSKSMRDYCKTNVLTLSSKFKDSFSGIGNALSYTIPHTYTPIITQEKETIYLITCSGNIGNINKKEYYVGKYNGTTNGEVIKRNDGTLSYAKAGNTDNIILSTYENVTFTPVSFSYLLDWNIRLENWKYENFEKDNDNTIKNETSYIDTIVNDNGEKTEYEYKFKNLNDKLNWVIKEIKKLRDYPYVFNINQVLDNSIPYSGTSYIWSGTSSQYKEINNNKNHEIFQNKKYSNSTTFVINDDNTPEDKTSEDKTSEDTSSGDTK